jgi:hypothetical protein
MANGSRTQWSQCAGTAELIVVAFTGKFPAGKITQFAQTFEADFIGLSDNIMKSIEQAAHSDELSKPSAPPLTATDDDDNAAAADDDDVCPVCMEPFTADNQLSLPCFHKFCSGCLKMWAEKHDNCPVCRTTVTDDAVAKMVNKKNIKGASRDVSSKTMTALSVKKLMFPNLPNPSDLPSSRRLLIGGSGGGGRAEGDQQNTRPAKSRVRKRGGAKNSVVKSSEACAIM